MSTRRTPTPARRLGRTRRLGSTHRLGRTARPGDQSPRGIAATGAALALALCFVAGCSASPAPASSGATRTVVDAEGTEVAVPVDPQRVVALSEPALDGLLALGIEPVGTVTGRGQADVPHYLADRAADIPLLGGVAQPNLEAIGAARPDLILVDGTSINNNPPLIESLRQLAPVVYTGFAGGDWRDNFAQVADAVGRADTGAEVVASYDAAVTAASARLGDYSNKTFSIVRWQGGSAALILNELLPGAALADLGLARPANQDVRGRGHSEPVSLENLADIDADYIFFGTLGGSSVDNADAGGSVDVSGAEQALAEAVKVPGFTQLAAYQNDHIIPVDGSVWTSTGGPLLMNRLIDDVVEALA